MARREATFTDRWGVEITYDVYSLDDTKEARGVVLLVHGIGDHASRYAHVAAAFNSAGFIVYAPDVRGHGRSGVKATAGDLTKLGHLGEGRLAGAIEDMVQLTEIIRRENPGLPAVFLGHSMGSIHGQILLNDHAGDYQAVIFTGACSRTLGNMAAGDLNKPFKGDGSTGHEWLSRDPAIWQDFKNDPWTFDADVLKIYGLVDGLKLFGRPQAGMAEVPILIAVGQDDSLGGEKSALKLADDYIKRASQTDVSVIVYPGARHEVFNETNKEQVLDDVISWLSERVS
jgi:alpha-beta hydrolase superfamily lysophospholipase